MGDKAELRKSWESSETPATGRQTVYRWLDADLTDDEGDSSAEHGTWTPSVHAHLPSTQGQESKLSWGATRRRAPRASCRTLSQKQASDRFRSRSRSQRRGAAEESRVAIGY